MKSQQTITLKTMERVIGSLSKPGKMPGMGTSTSATKCKTGSFLRTIEGSTCSKCYAHGGQYRYPSVKIAHSRRLAGLSDENWAIYMAETIKRKKIKEFRWHDSGDLQGMNHLRNIIKVVKSTPEVSHWLPTREYKMLLNLSAEEQAFCRSFVRVSAPMQGTLEQNANKEWFRLNHNDKRVRLLKDQFQALIKLGFKTSTVGALPHWCYDKEAIESGLYFDCPAVINSSTCDKEKCRACWESKVNVNYPLHK